MTNRKLQEKYRIDLAAIAVPTKIVDHLESAYNHLLAARRELAEAESTAVTDDLKDQVSQIHAEFVRSNNGVVEALVDLMDLETNGLMEARRRKIKMILKKLLS